jgi:plastocyanin
MGASTTLPFMKRLGPWLALGAMAAGATGQASAQGADLRGKLTILDKGGKRGTDVVTAVVWRDGAGTARAGSVQVVTQNKAFAPEVVIVAPGSSVSFPNYDPFNHNVFSLAEEGPFDLGLYGRGETRTTRFDKPGVIRVYCNVHAQMAAVVVVLTSSLHTRPAPDGSFTLSSVPPGRYQLHAWHDRGGQVSQEVVVGVGGAAPIELTLDASSFRQKPHLNKFGKPYPSEGRRY